MADLEDMLSQETLDVTQLIVSHPEVGNHWDELDLSAALYFHNIPTSFKLEKISDINQFHNLVLFRGTVLRISTMKSVCKWIEYKCQQCGALQKVYSDPSTYFSLDQPVRCEGEAMKQVRYHPFFNNKKGPKFKKMPCKSTYFKRTDTSQLIDYQELKVQDPYTTLKPGVISNSIRVMLEGRFVNQCKPGDDVIIGGLVIKRWKTFKQMPSITLWVDCKYLQTIKQPKLQISLDAPTDSLSQRASIMKSFHPELCGLWEVKLAILLSLIGGVSHVQNGTQLRGDSHLLLIGESGTGKSSLLRQACSVSERAIYVNGIGVSQAGLTVSFVKEGNDWIVEAGALVLADQGVCCIDELTMLSQQCLQGLLEALEQQSVSSSKAGILTKLNARATIIAACNPMGQIYNNDLSIEQNTGLSTPLLSRFDMVMIMKDQHDPDIDRELCEHFLTEGDGAGLPANDLKSYLNYVKSNINPEIGDECQRVLQNYYKRLRASLQYITARKLEGMIRMSEAHARLCGRKEINRFDVTSIIALNEISQPTGLLSLLSGVLLPTVSKNDIEEAWETVIKL